MNFLFNLAHSWNGWGVAAVLGLTYCVSALIAALSAAVPFFNYRRQRAAHWTEKARALHPLRRALSFNHLIVCGGALGPLIGVYPFRLGFSGSFIYWAMPLAAICGSHLPQYFVTRSIFPELRNFLYWSTEIIFRYFFVLNFVLILGVSYLLLVSFSDLNNQWGISAAWTIAAVFYIFGGWSLSIKITGRCRRAGERLQRIVLDVAARMNVRAPCRIYEVKMFVPNAWALPPTGELFFTKRLLAHLDDAEVAAIAAHEIAHLQEPRSALFKRYAPPILITLLMINVWFWLADRFFSLVFCELGLIFLRFKIQRKIANELEHSADETALGSELGEGTYAKALCKIYELSLVPAVIGGKNLSHPELYDRMIAAGVKPDFERPAKPSLQGYWWSVVISVLLTVVVVGVVVNDEVARWDDDFYGDYEVL